jgi:acetyl-CoA carboxylase biotin carboxyl carrier protein
MKLTEIQELIKFVARSGVNEVEIEQKDFKIIIKTETKRPRKEETYVVPAAPTPVQAVPVAQEQSAPAPLPSAPVASSAPKSDESKYVTIKSPMIGTFYRAPGPGKEVFVNVGDTIQKGKVLCIIEAMKLFNEIEAEISGKIVKVLVEDASPVEYDQPLFLVDPA